MKYTPYPNYVRISKPELLTIMNQEEVTARDQKRAEDAAKQAARLKAEERRKNGGARFGERKSFGDKKFDKKPYERNSNGERKSFGDKKPYERNAYGERKSFGDKKTYDRSSYGERKPYDTNRRYENREFQSGEKFVSTERKYVRNDGRKGNIVITTGNASSGYYKKPYQKPAYDRGERSDGATYGRKSYDKKPYNKDYSERKSYDGNGGYEKKGYSRGGYTNNGYN